jgi:hypothetical protein
MSVIRWKSFARRTGPGLCRTCVWGTVRKGLGARQEEVICRLIAPNTVVPFAVNECTDYADRRVPVVAEKVEDRRYGFVTEISLRDRQSQGR